jgi:hypothetical protein
VTLRKHFLPLLLCFLLLGAQHMGWMHALSHFAGADGSSAVGESAKKRVPTQADKVCEQCLAFAQIAAALDRATFVFIADSTQLRDAPATRSQDAPATDFIAFRSRAPPVVF